MIFILYGAQWLPAALPLSALLVAQFFGVAFGMNWELFVLRGETGRQARYEVARLVLGVPIFVIGCLFSILAAALVAGVAVTVLTQIFGRHHIGFRVSLAQWRPITTFGLQMMSVSGVAMITGKLSDLLLGRILGVAALGLYGRASNLSGIIFENLYGTVTRVVFVQLSKDYREGGDWRGTYLRSFAMITAFMWPFLIGLVLYYPHVRRLAQLDRYAIPKVYRDSGILTVMAVLPALVTMIVYDWSPRTPLPVVAGVGILGIALWFGTIIVMRHPLHDEMLIVWRRFRKTRAVV
ncbi:MAG: hypothetical protein EOP67_36160 [Sphingomonas sp.]|nr:MAG: hypothetical protein EOP67_36160 [Sphingomonas sp.]